MATPTKLRHPSPQITAGALEIGGAGQREYDFEIVDDHYLIYVAQCQSRLDVTSNGKTLHKGLLFPGMMRLASPGEKVHVDLFARCRAATLSIPGPFVRQTLDALKERYKPGKVSYMDAFLQPRPEVAQLGRMLLHHEPFDAEHGRLFVQGVTETLLAYLLRNHGWTLREPPLVDRLTESEVRRATEFVDANMDGPLTLERWASALQLPADDFRRRFRRTLGVSPYAWYMERRIERAKFLLGNTEEALTQIALDIGFSSQSHFTEAFRKQVGMPPARWREQRRGTQRK